MDTIKFHAIALSSDLTTLCIFDMRVVISLLFRGENEAVRLREAGLTTPILIFGYTPPPLAKKLVEFDLTPTL